MHFLTRKKSQPQAQFPQQGMANRRTKSQPLVRRLKLEPEAPPEREEPPPKPFLNINVADFISLPQGRFSAVRDSLGPLDCVRRPPSYNFTNLPGMDIDDDDVVDNRMPERELSAAECYSPGRGIAQDFDSTDLPKDMGDDVYMINDCSHIDNLLSIIASQRSEQSSDYDISEKVKDLLHRRGFSFDSDRESLEDMDDIDEVDDFPSFVRVQSMASSMISKSSSEDSTFPETLTEDESQEGTIGTSNTPSSPSVDSTVPCVFVTVDTAGSLNERVSTNRGAKMLPTFMRRPVPSPARYTFRPVVQTPSHRRDRREFSELKVVPKVVPQALVFDGVMKRRESSVLSAVSNRTGSEPPTLQAVKKIVDSVDPKAALSIANAPPLALATMGLFRKKRISNESADSTETEYYEDEYTKFIEKKTIPLSPLRLKPHPYLARMMGIDGWSLKTSRAEDRSCSPISVSTSDEEYIPRGCSQSSEDIAH